MTIRGMVFDLDGTLIDFVAVFDEIIHETFAAFDVEFTKERREELKAMALNMVSGKSSKFLIVKILWRVAKSLGLSFRQRVRFLKLANKNYRDHIKDVRVFPGAFEKVSAFREQGLKTALVTSASREEVEHRFEGRSDLLDHFDFVVGRDSVKNMKPAPDGILLVARELGLPPGELVMVGDMTFDVLAGKNATARTIGVLTGYGTRAELEAAGADLVVSSVAEIPETLDHW